MGHNWLKTKILFQFTHPGRGATKIVNAISFALWVSIHPPREGCDPFSVSAVVTTSGFNSRTPGGVRRFKIPLTPL